MCEVVCASDRFVIQQDGKFCKNSLVWLEDIIPGIVVHYWAESGYGTTRCSCDLSILQHAGGIETGDVEIVERVPSSNERTITEAFQEVDADPWKAHIERLQVFAFMVRADPVEKEEIFVVAHFTVKLITLFIPEELVGQVQQELVQQGVSCTNVDL